MISSTMSKRLRLRAATVQDAEAIADVFLAARLRYLSFAPLVHSVEDVRAWMREVLVPQGVTVAEVLGKPVGFIAARERDGFGWIEQLYVHPACINCGVGGQLLAYALESLPANVRLYTFQQNARAQHFYEKHGFSAIEFTDGRANEEGCPDILYELRQAEHEGREEAAALA